MIKRLLNLKTANGARQLFYFSWLLVPMWYICAFPIYVVALSFVVQESVFFRIVMISYTIIGIILPAMLAVFSVHNLERLNRKRYIWLLLFPPSLPFCVLIAQAPISNMILAAAWLIGILCLGYWPLLLYGWLRKRILDRYVDDGLKSRVEGALSTLFKPPDDEEYQGGEG
jgi:hypothetical protein